MGIRSFKGFALCVALTFSSAMVMVGGSSELAVGAGDSGTPSIFGPVTDVALNEFRPFGISHPSADLDGDGDVDLAVSTEGTSTDRAGGKLVFLQNDGSGSFSVPAAETLPLLTAADTANPNTVSVGRGLVAQDVNGDGKPDLVVADAGQGQSNPPGPSRSNAPGWVLVYLNTNTTPGDISFQRLPAMEVGRRPLGVALADFNEDGKPDIGIDNEDADAAQLLLGNGDGTFTIAQTVSFKVDPNDTSPRSLATCDSPHFPAAGDLTGDGHVDLLTGCNNNGGITIDPCCSSIPRGILILLPGDGQGGLGEPVVVDAGRCNDNGNPSFPSVACRPHVPHVEDVNGDKKQDITIADTGPRGTNRRVTVLLGQGGTSFFEDLGSPYTATDVDQAFTSFQVTEHFSGRQDGSADNDLDILSVSGPRSFKPSTPRPWSHLVLHQNDHKKSAAATGPLYIQAPGSPFVINGVDGDPLLQELTSGDFNGDGKLDAAVVWIDTIDGPFNPIFNLPTIRTTGPGFVAVLLHN